MGPRGEVSAARPVLIFPIFSDIRAPFIDSVSAAASSLSFSFFSLFAARDQRVLSLMNVHAVVAKAASAGGRTERHGRGSDGLLAADEDRIAEQEHVIGRLSPQFIGSSSVHTH